MIEKCLEALNSGGIVLFPTDTVYGLLARQDKAEAVDQIYKIKKRSSDKPLIKLIPYIDANDPDIEQFGPRAMHFLRSVWPGPVTVVGPNCHSLRWADHDDLNELLRKCDGPIVSTSANISGQKEASCLQDVDADVLNQVQASFDGPCGQEGPSVVLEVNEDGFEVLRKGPVDHNLLRYLWCTRIAFVCTGNTCRSPMAEALARDLLQRKLKTNDLTSHHLWVESAGVYAAAGMAASSHSVEALKKKSIQLQSHQSQAINHLIEYPPDYLYGMTRSHVGLLQDLGLKAELLDPNGQDVIDPFGGSYDDYDRCREQIEQSVKQRLHEWL